MDKLFITDLEGEQKEVTDLNAAIEQTDWFRKAEHVIDKDTSPIEVIRIKEHDKKLQAYWQDMYEKLIALKNQTDCNIPA